MTFGNYVLFNLLVAILVEGFKCQNELFIEVSNKFIELIFEAGKLPCTQGLESSLSSWDSEEGCDWESEVSSQEGQERRRRARHISSKERSNNITDIGGK